MELEPPKTTWTQNMKRPFTWVLAAAIALLVSIADVKLPAETREEHADAGPALSDLNPFSGPESAFSDESEALDAYAFQFEPSQEPVFDSLDFHIHQAAGQYDVDFDLIRAIISAESRFDSRARSKKGARGLMQLMPLTAVGLDVEDLYDPAENIDAGVRYFRSLLDRFDGNVALALAAYNAGPSNVIRYDGVPPYRETRIFISKVFSYYSAMKEDAAK
jgi:soluble lytic murein transglycosylase-like protein